MTNLDYKNSQDDRIRMSHSSTNLINSCQQRYTHKKILKTAIDTDAVEDYKAFKIGKVFHEALENCLHDKQAYSTDLVFEAAKIHEVTDQSEILMIQAMVQKYFDIFTATKLTCVAVEDEVGDENIIGFVDALMIDRNKH